MVLPPPHAQALPVVIPAAYVSYVAAVAIAAGVTFTSTAQLFSYSDYIWSISPQTVRDNIANDVAAITGAVSDTGQQLAEVSNSVWDFMRGHI